MCVKLHLVCVKIHICTLYNVCRKRFLLWMESAAAVPRDIRPLSHSLTPWAAHTSFLSHSFLLNASISRPQHNYHHRAHCSALLAQISSAAKSFPRGVVHYCHHHHHFQYHHHWHHHHHHYCWHCFPAPLNHFLEEVFKSTLLPPATQAAMINITT